ncbi:MAG: hypothetical protein FJX75_12490 [Armatimonadetes bacterium]|nr:hypothetical protein [Armatimonadota bacterium]
MNVNDAPPVRFSPQAAITWRAVIIALLLIPPNCWFVLHGYFFGNSRPTTVSLIFNVAVTLFLLGLLNRLVARRFPGRQLHPGEMVTIYAMLSVSSALCGLDQVQTMMPVVAYPHHYATDENKWEQLFLRDTPGWLSPRDPETLKAYYDSHQSMFATTAWHGWLKPAGAWMAFVFALMVVMLCLNVLFRKQWTEEAKLSFPVVQLPLEMARENTPLYRNRLLWIGFGVAFFVDLMRGLHVMYPMVPDLWGERAANDLGTMVREPPWNAIGWTPLNVMPFGVGLAFLIPQDVAFSSWFFYVLWKFVRIGTVAAGWGDIPRAPWIDEQSFGAYIALAAFCLYASRHHLRHAILSGIGRGTGGLAREGGGSSWARPPMPQRGFDDSAEPLPYAWALYGLILGTTFLVIWCVAAGMTPFFALAFIIGYLLISVAVARIRAELGSPVHDLHKIGPEVILAESFGPPRVGKANLILFSYFWSLTRAHRSHPMPHQLESMKLAAETHTSQRGLSVALLIATVLGILLGWGFLLEMCHRYGGERIRWKGFEAFSRLDGWLRRSPEPNVYTIVTTLVGFAFTTFLAAMRARFAWWPFHPAGFAVSGSWSMALFAPSIFAAWLLKAVLLRYRGMTSYRPATFFFYGLILGEFVAGTGWGILGNWMQRPMYNFLP